MRRVIIELHTESVFLVGIGRYFSVFTIPISVSIFGQYFGGAPQKIGGSPLFPKKGGPWPPFWTPPFKEKKEFPRNFSKKEYREILKRCSRQSLQYNKTNQKIPIPAVSDTSLVCFLGAKMLQFF